MALIADNLNLGKGLHIAHLNVRSLIGGHKFDALRHQIRTCGIQIVTISESCLYGAVPDKTIKVEGYNSTRVDRSWRDDNGGDKQVPKKGGGLVCYVKEGIKYSDSKLKHLNVSCKDLEMMWLKISIDNVRPIVIVNVYRPPRGSYVKGCELISEAFERANLKDNTDIFMTGDFNINYRDKTAPAYKELDFTTKSLGLKQLISSATRLAFRDGALTETTLDLVFTNSEHVSQTQTLDFNIIDHLGILVTRKKTPVKQNKITFRGRSYRNYDKEGFQESLVDTDWTELYNSTQTGCGSSCITQC